MKKLKLTIVGDTPYAGRLAACMQKNGPDYLEVSRCIHLQELVFFIEKIQPDIVLCEQECKLPEKLPKHIVTIFLTDTKGVCAKEEPTIFRYQQGTEILRKMFQIFEHKSNKNVFSAHKAEDLEMIGIYAPGGNELQLPFSIAYASICGETRKVLYLNLTEFSGMSVLMKEKEGENLSDLIYGIRQKQEKFLLCLQSVLHHTENFDYVQSPSNPEDLYTIQEEDIACLLSFMKEQTDYNLIIWNCGALNPLISEVLDHCSKIFCVGKESSFGKFRTKEFQQFLDKQCRNDMQQKVRFVHPQAGNDFFVQGISLFTQLQSGEFVNQVKRLIENV